MSFKMAIDKDDMPIIIKMLNTKYANTFYDILGEEIIGGIPKVSITVNSGKEDELFEDLFDSIGDIVIIENINTKER